MAHRERVFIDTCIWVQFFNRPRSEEKQAVDDLLDNNDAALIGPIFAEILLGFRRQEQADWVASKLRGVYFVDPTKNEWRSAASVGRELIARGHDLPLSDLILAAVAVERKFAVYSTDPHFNLFPELKRFRP